MDGPMPPSLVKTLDTLEDPRVDRTKLHDLTDILVLAVICGTDSFMDIALFGQFNEAWLRTFLELLHEIPSHDTLRRALARLDATRFEEVSVDQSAAAQFGAAEVPCDNGRNPTTSECRRTFSIGCPAVPAGSPSSEQPTLAVEPGTSATKVQQLWLASSYRVLTSAIKARAASASDAGASEQMNRLRRMTCSDWTIAAGIAKRSFIPCGLQVAVVRTAKSDPLRDNPRRISHLGQAASPSLLAGLTSTAPVPYNQNRSHLAFPCVRMSRGWSACG